MYDPDMADDLTDRDRLAIAFDELNQQGYLAPIDFAWTVCCNRCGMTAINELAQVGDLQSPCGYVFWHSQKDGHAFFPDGISPMPESVKGAIEAEGLRLDDDDEQIGVWMTEHREQIEAALTDERMSKYNKVLKPLYLHWAGELSIIVAVLRKHGLSVHEPVSPDRCIGIFPS